VATSLYPLAAAVPKNYSMFLMGGHSLLPQSPSHPEPRIIQKCATTKFYLKNRREKETSLQYPVLDESLLNLIFIHANE
jgi:hypothetical protein